MKYARHIQNLLNLEGVNLDPHKDASHYYQTMCRLIRASDCTIDRITPYLTAPVAPLEYGRNQIYCSDLFEVIVLHVPSKVETPVHDHGEACCCVHVIKGSVLNRVYRKHANETLEILSSKHFTADEFFYSPHGQIHSMYNPTDQPIVTLHVYTPPISGNHIYPNNVLQSHKEGV
ncbi:cysteine dioxygenase [Thermoactinomyces sp. DSM 45891]|uniref:cysteine dioxygenase n=1 Tax=Thermoactinomyces sp. DSM 45891 TaxID=1761907 RepID=UPI00091368AD|nr:cysteine dioxygenase family protein [Thermoactinomyces sp. DSM 45891]SFX21233.1 cysteine dioxygenase [Thermoactinomyces sp. DSM 45891]